MAKPKVSVTRRATQSPVKLQHTVTDLIARALHQAGLQVERHQIDGQRLPSLEVWSKRHGVVIHVEQVIDQHW